MEPTLPCHREHVLFMVDFRGPNAGPDAPISESGVHDLMMRAIDSLIHSIREIGTVAEFKIQSVIMISKKIRDLRKMEVSELAVLECQIRLDFGYLWFMSKAPWRVLSSWGCLYGLCTCVVKSNQKNIKVIDGIRLP